LKNKIQIISWLLTRRCNLSCDYCAIVKDYKNKPQSYPDMKHYFEKEMNSEYVIKTLRRIKNHNPDAFHIFYGGEPLLRKDLADIINFCNIAKIHYTIITNNSDDIQKLIEELLENVEYIEGITSSVDPLIMDKTADKSSDRYKKCVAGLERLQGFKGKIKDIVAEITVDNSNFQYLYDLVKMLTDMGINSDITTVDIAKNNYYDFSNIRSNKNADLVPKLPSTMAMFQKIINDKLNVHMAETLLPQIYDILPAELDCELEKNIHNMTIDADGSMRMCLRIRGVLTPNMKAYDCIMDNGELHPIFKELISIDKRNYCLGCNWSCPIMSRLLLKGEDNVESLVHYETRNKK